MKTYDYAGQPKVGEKFVNDADGMVYMTVADALDATSRCAGCAFDNNSGCSSAPDCPIDGHFVATGEKAPEKTMTVCVCTLCGGANVLQDAFVHANDKDDIRTFDDYFCEDCDCSVSVQKVEVPITFDIYSDKFDLTTLRKEG